MEARTLQTEVKSHIEDAEVPRKPWVLSLWFVLCEGKTNYFAYHHYILDLSATAESIPYDYTSQISVIVCFS